LKERNPLQEKNRGSLFIVSAPSGAGKTTLCKRLLSSLPDLRFSISYTTRQPRQGEVHDRDYTFVSRKDFSSMIEKNEFIEWAEVHGELYGTSRKRLDEFLGNGYDVILDIDTQGALQIKERYRKGTYIFILPPSLEILQKRLAGRKTDSREEIEKRLTRAIEEIKTYSRYDYVIINDKLENALREFGAIIISQRVTARKINPLWIKERFCIKEDK
jgi:guanylate kinase